MLGRLLGFLHSLLGPFLCVLVFKGNRYFLFKSRWKHGPDDNEDSEDDFLGLSRGPYLFEIEMGECEEFCIGL